MSIPLAMSPVGYDTWVTELKRALITFLGTFQLEVDYLPDEKKLVVHTDRVSDEEYAEVAEIAAEYMPSGVTLEQYNHNMEVNWRDINKYAECKTVGDVMLVNPDYKNDLTSDGEWVYPLPELVNAYAYDYTNRKYLGMFEDAENLRKIKLILPKATNISYMFRMIQVKGKLEEIDIEAPLVNGTNYTVCGHIIQGNALPKKMRFILPKQRYLDQFLWSRAPQYPQSLELYAPKMEKAWLGFIYASLDKPSAMGIFNQLQTFTSSDHPLDIGIHVDHQNDPEILAAISDAESKGWTLTVQWNPGGPTYTTPTA